MEYVFLSVLIVIAMSFAIAQMSKEKEIGFWTLFAISIVFSPLVGLIVGLTRKNRNENKTMFVAHNNVSSELQPENANTGVSEER